jgi:hypothetical protein
MEEPTDRDLVTDHPYEATFWPDTCGHCYPNGWMCGYTQAEHERGNGAPPEGGGAIEKT